MVKNYIIFILFTCVFSQNMLTVNNGYGSGNYNTGDTIHVWSNLNPLNNSFGGWDGNIEFLINPNEWHTKLIMPNTDIIISAQNISMPEINFENELIMGAQNFKDVYYIFPENPKATIIMFHGGSGNASDFANRVEGFQFYNDMLNAQYSIIITESEDRTLNDQNQDGVTQWQLLPLDLTNIDIINIQTLIDTFTIRGNINAEYPVFAVGVSNGGNFASVVSYALDFDVSVMFSSQGNPPELYEVTNIPTIFCPAKYDPALGGGNVGALMNYEVLLNRNIPVEYFELDKSPLYSQRFSRIEQIDDEMSNQLMLEFQNNNLIDENNFFTILDDVFIQYFQENPQNYPIFQSLPIYLKKHVTDQLKVVTADHSFFSNFNHKINDIFINYLILFGDMNNDGHINVVDIVSLVNLILDSDYQINGDLNQDGLLNVIDIVQLVNEILTQ